MVLEQCFSKCGLCCFLHQERLAMNRASVELRMLSGMFGFCSREAHYLVVDWDFEGHSSNACDIHVQITARQRRIGSVSHVGKQSGSRRDLTERVKVKRDFLKTVRWLSWGLKGSFGLKMQDEMERTWEEKGIPSKTKRKELTKRSESRCSCENCIMYSVLLFVSFQGISRYLCGTIGNLGYLIRVCFQGICKKEVTFIKK